MNKQNDTQNKIKRYLKSRTFHKMLACVGTVLMAFIIIYSGAMPVKYKISLGEKSDYDITAPKDIENSVKTEQLRQDAAKKVPPVTKAIDSAPIEVISALDSFFNSIEEERKTIQRNLMEKGVTMRSRSYEDTLDYESFMATGRLMLSIKGLKIPLSVDQARYLLTSSNDNDFKKFKTGVRDVIFGILKEDITSGNLLDMVNKGQNDIQKSHISQDFKNIGNIVIKTILKPNRTIDLEMTRINRDKEYSKPENVIKILKGERIISRGDEVTLDKYKILENLNLLETKSRFDLGFAVCILLIIILLSFLLILYMHHFCKRTINSRNEILILCITILLTLAAARMVYGIAPDYYQYAVPVFIAPMMISILVDLKLACFVNIILAIAITFITKGNPTLLYLTTISGTFSAFLVSKASQRSKLSLAGLVTGIMNIIIVASLGIINKSDYETISIGSFIAFLNGVISIILTIGILPFWEITLNIITPFKLLELANPNQPLIKRLLMEAPGTYHHSLMVGNLAEVATEAIGGDALLARVGAYFHDIGKLKRPEFFRENQLTSTNPHDKITPNLSTLVITSHIDDGLELAQKYKLPPAIKEIISQHHGTTLVVYFYHKALSEEKNEGVSQENFRYRSQKPRTKEAAVVMLADSVEAAVRSVPDKTEGQVEGLVRKIIKDKLDDGQLDLCNLSLKDLDTIAKAFMKVLNGVFHGREVYPEINKKTQEEENKKLPAVAVYQLDKTTDETLKN